jgi:hypothetical protein
MGCLRLVCPKRGIEAYRSFLPRFTKTRVGREGIRRGGIGLLEIPTRSLFRAGASIQEVFNEGVISNLPIRGEKKPDRFKHRNYGWGVKSGFSFQRRKHRNWS